MAPVFSGLRLFPSTPYPSLPHNRHVLRRPSLCWRWNQFSFTNVSFSPCTGKAPSPTLHFDAAHIPRQYPRHRNRFPPQPGMWVSSPGSRSGPCLSKGVQQKFTEKYQLSYYVTALFNPGISEDLKCKRWVFSRTYIRETFWFFCLKLPLIILCQYWTVWECNNSTITDTYWENHL